jgi:hypothetical protein
MGISLIKILIERNRLFIFRADMTLKNRICRMFGIKFPFTYLGVKMAPRKLHKSVFHNLITREQFS